MPISRFTLADCHEQITKARPHLGRAHDKPSPLASHMHVPQVINLPRSEPSQVCDGQTQRSPSAHCDWLKKGCSVNMPVAGCTFVGRK